MLKTVIKSMVEAGGMGCLRDARVVNVLADYNAFGDCVAAKFVLKTFIQEGFVDRLGRCIDGGSYTAAVGERMVDDLYNRYGFRRDVAALVVNALLYANGLPEVSAESAGTPVASVEDAEAPQTQAATDEHIVFSGISLGHSMDEIEKHLSGRGFMTKKVKPYQIEMKGTFCDIDDVELFINGSPLGVTRCVVMRYKNKSIGMLQINVKKLYKLIHTKYGEPSYVKDSLCTIRQDFIDFTDKTLVYSEKMQNFEEILEYKWHVIGGDIVLYWIGESVHLIYEDEVNTRLSDEHQIKFDEESI